MNKYIDHIEKKAGLMDIPMSLGRIGTKAFSLAGKGIGKITSTSLGKKHREYANKTLFGGNARPEDLLKFRSPSQVHRAVLKKQRDLLRSQGFKGPLFAKATRTETYGSLIGKHEAKLKSQGYLGGEFKRAPEYGSRTIDRVATPLRKDIKDLNHVKLDAKITAGTLGVAGVYGASKLHDKIREKLRPQDDSSQYTY